MNETAREIETSVQEARNKLLGMQAAMRKGKTVRLLGTLVALVIVVIYVFLFIGLIKGAADVDKLAEEARKKLQDPTLQDSLKYEVTQLANDVRPVYQREFERKATEIQLASLLRTELEELVKEVGPEYGNALRDAATDLELMDGFRNAVEELAEEVGPVYGQELSRIAPEIFTAAGKAREALLEDLAQSVETWLKEALSEALARNAESMAVQAELSEEELEAKLADIVVAVENALHSMVTKRTAKWETDLGEIQGMLDEIPEAKNKDTGYLVDELVKTSLLLVSQEIAERIPEDECRFEWEGEGQ